MSLAQIARKSRMLTIPEETDICVLLFKRPKTVKAARLFLDWLKTTGGPYPGATRSEVSQFGRDLQAGLIDPEFTYGRKAFYATILRRLVDLGFIGLRYRGRDRKGRSIEKYVPIHQPITLRPPSRKNFWNICWHICKKWNDEFGDLL